MAAIDVKSAEALVSDAARAFSEGLKGLTERALAEAHEERQRLADEAVKQSEGKKSLETERRRLEELQAQLNEEKRQLERGFARLAQDRAELESSQARRTAGSTPSFGGDASPCGRCRVAPAGVWGSDQNVHGNTASGSSGSQGMLSRCPDEVLASACNGRSSFADYAAVAGGRILVDFRPAIFALALEKFADAEDAPVAADGAELERRFMNMLAQHGLRGWVYREICEEVESSVSIRGRRYAVLPTSGPEEASVLLDMYDSIVNVPLGWEVLSTGQDGFNDVIQELAKNGWGTSLLCVRNADGGFSSYRTALYTHGAAAGTRVSADSRVLQALDEQDSQFKFSAGMVLSGRLVICTSRGACSGNR